MAQSEGSVAATRFGAGIPYRYLRLALHTWHSMRKSTTAMPEVVHAGLKQQQGYRSTIGCTGGAAVKAPDLKLIKHSPL